MFAKYWSAGKVKTRLARSIGADAAAEFHRLSVATLVTRFRHLADQRLIGFWPGEQQAAFARLGKPHWQTVVQVAGDLGDRMACFFDAAFRAGAERVVLIGSDSPTLPVQYVEDAFASLLTHEVVLGPADDGGYYLVGAAHNRPDIFRGVTWSSRDVWTQTVERLESTSTSWAALPPWYDVDDMGQLRRLAEQLKSDEYKSLAWDDLRRMVLTFAGPH